jgi:L-alanine-DL-glutamate epimerase-like enolase superfamily enzyme
LPRRAILLEACHECLLIELPVSMCSHWDSTGNPFVDQLISPLGRLDEFGWLRVSDDPGIGFEPDIGSLAGEIVKVSA